MILGKKTQTTKNQTLLTYFLFLSPDRGITLTSLENQSMEALSEHFQPYRRFIISNIKPLYYLFKFSHWSVLSKHIKYINYLIYAAITSSNLQSDNLSHEFSFKEKKGPIFQISTAFYIK